MMKKQLLLLNVINISKTDKKYSTDIFTMNNIKAELNVNAIQMLKNTYTIF